MTSLIASLKWDEQRYGLEYDLDLFNVRFLIAFPYRLRCEIPNHSLSNLPPALLNFSPLLTDCGCG